MLHHGGRGMLSCSFNHESQLAASIQIGLSSKSYIQLVALVKKA